MGTYNLPRNVKGEGRILFIFSAKALVYTAIGGACGLPLYLIFSILSMNIVGLICIALLGLVGFIIGTFKVPDSTSFKITQKTGGENIDDVIRRGIKFKMQKNKIYVYENEVDKEVEKEETKDE